MSIHLIAKKDSQQPCSRFYYSSTCNSGCGVGVNNCIWRRGPEFDGQVGEQMTSLYSTCSPDLTYCPDKICDELEIKYPSLCPQDCIGWFLTNMLCNISYY